MKTNTVAIVIVFLMLFCSISEYFHLLIVSQGVRDAIQTATTAVVTENYDNTYHTSREGYSGGYLPTSSGFIRYLNNGEVSEQVDELLGLNSSHSKENPDGSMEYSLSNLHVHLQNTDFAPGNPNEGVTAECMVMLTVPLTFAGHLLPPLQTTLQTKSGFTPLF